MQWYPFNETFNAILKKEHLAMGQVTCFFQDKAHPYKQQRQKQPLIYKWKRALVTLGAHPAFLVYLAYKSVFRKQE